jgi:hypothetical protein
MTTQEINTKVEALKAKGCKLSDSAIIAIIMKGEKNSSKNISRKAKGFERRLEEENNPSLGNLIVDGITYNNMSDYNHACGARIMRNK